MTEREIQEMLSCFSRSDEALEARAKLGRPLTEDELYSLLVYTQVQAWVETILEQEQA